MARIILHVGTHKTGTTGLQRSLFAQRDVLAHNGICYDPWPGELSGPKYAHHGLAHRLARFDACDQKVLANYRLRIEQALAQGKDVIISAEPFYRQEAAEVLNDPDAARVQFLDRVAAYFKNLPVEVSICFRRPDRMAESLFKEQSVSTDNRLDFLPWLDKFSSRFDYAARLAEFEQRLGPAKVWCFEDAVVKGLLPTFLQIHGLHVSGIVDATADRKSISARSAIWMLRVKQAQGGMSRSARRIRWCYTSSSHANVALTDKRGETFWADAKTRNAFLSAVLAGFRHADFWNRPNHEPEQVDLTEQKQVELEAHFQRWLKESSVLLKMRKAAKLDPYESDDAIPDKIRRKFLFQRIRVRLFRVLFN